jgi:hypothetical protein
MVMTGCSMVLFSAAELFTGTGDFTVTGGRSYVWFTFRVE